MPPPRRGPGAFPRQPASAAEGPTRTPQAQPPPPGPPGGEGARAASMARPGETCARACPASPALPRPGFSPRAGQLWRGAAGLPCAPVRTRLLALSGKPDPPSPSPVPVPVPREARAAAHLPRRRRRARLSAQARRRASRAHARPQPGRQAEPSAPRGPRGAPPGQLGLRNRARAGGAASKGWEAEEGSQPPPRRTLDGAPRSVSRQPEELLPRATPASPPPQPWGAQTAPHPGSSSAPRHAHRPSGGGAGRTPRSDPSGPPGPTLPGERPLPEERRRPEQPQRFPQKSQPRGDPGASLALARPPAAPPAPGQEPQRNGLAWGRSAGLGWGAGGGSSPGPAAPPFLSVCLAVTPALWGGASRGSAFPPRSAPGQPGSAPLQLPRTAPAAPPALVVTSTWPGKALGNHDLSPHHSQARDSGERHFQNPEFPLEEQKSACKYHLSDSRCNKQRTFRGYPGPQEPQCPRPLPDETEHPEESALPPRMRPPGASPICFPRLKHACVTRTTTTGAVLQDICLEVIQALMQRANAPGPGLEATPPKGALPESAGGRAWAGFHLHISQSSEMGTKHTPQHPCGLLHTPPRSIMESQNSPAGKVLMKYKGRYLKQLPFVTQINVANIFILVQGKLMTYSR